VPGVPRRPGGGVCGDDQARSASARRAQRSFGLAAGHHVPLALACPELQQLFQKGAGAHGPAPLATEIHGHGTHVYWRGGFVKIIIHLLFILNCSCQPR